MGSKGMSVAHTKTGLVSDRKDGGGAAVQGLESKHSSATRVHRLGGISRFRAGM